MDEWLAEIPRNLAENLVSLRGRRKLSQAALARLCKVPRSTIAHMESGEGNPSLSNLSRVAGALQVSVEELLSRPRSGCLLLRRDGIRSQKRNRGVATIFKLLPDPIPGMEIDRIEMERGGSFGGVPHTAGTKEYMSCVKGEITVTVLGERHRVGEGDVLAFPGDQPHSYHNTGSSKAVCFSVVVLARKFG
jgi:transcriptional regulator with XRE-family HTH domain